MPEKKPAAPRGSGKEPARKRVDWEAVERDYRAGKMTLREMAAKHGCTNGRVAQVAKERAWARGDLKEQVQKATQALLIAEEVSAEVSRVKQGLSETVVAAAETNRQVILGHRKHATDARLAMEAARAKLLSLGASAADIREAATFASAVESLSRTAKNVIEIERTAFGLEAEAKAPEKLAPLDWSTIPEAERQAAYMRMVQGG